jgi:molecular chaperone GrpE
MSIEKSKIEYVPEESEATFDAPEKKVKKLKEEIKDFKEKLREQRDAALRALADYQNLQKRVEREKEETIEFANLNFVRDLLPSLDSFDMALEHLKDNPDSPEEAEQDGMEKVYNQLIAALKSNGVEKINAVGEKFNPEFHESIEVVEDEKSGVVVEEIQKGYTLHGKTIRPSKVKIGK